MKRMHLLLARRGLSLVEVVNSIAASTIVIIVTTGVFLLLLRTYFLYSARTVLTTEASTVVQRYSDLVQGAVEVEASASVLGATYTTDKDTLVLRVNAVDASAETIIGAYDHIVLTIDEGNATRMLEVVDADAQSTRSDVTKTLSGNVYDLTFTYENSAPSTTAAVFASLTLKENVQTTSVYYTLDAYAKLRNN